MFKNLVLICSCFILLFACAKKIVPQPELPTEKTPIIKFMFVNRLGFRSDSTRHGVNDTIFQGPCLDLKYYDKKANRSYLVGTCYNRNFPENNYPLKDSILFQEYEPSIGCNYKYKIDMIWKRATTLATTKVLSYNIKKYPDADTLKFARDTVIKFIWPDDTASGRFIKTYQWP